MNNIEPHVTSLQLSKQLHEAGFVRGSNFYHVKGVHGWQVIYGDNWPSNLPHYRAYLETELNTELRKVVINTLLDNATDELRELVRKVESLWNNPNLLEDKGKLVLYLIQHQLIQV